MSETAGMTHQRAGSETSRIAKIARERHLDLDPIRVQGERGYYVQVRNAAKDVVAELHTASEVETYCRNLPK